MGVCELCGSEKVGTRKAVATGTRLDACNRCIERMNLKVIEAPKPIIPKSTTNNQTKVTGRGVTGKDIMARGEKELSPNFHLLIREGRKKKGWDQRTFALRMNERLNIIQKIENGGRPTDSLINKIQKVLDIDLYVERESMHTSKINKDKRNLTIGDALEDLLSRRGD